MPSTSSNMNRGPCFIDSLNPFASTSAIFRAAAVGSLENRNYWQPRSRIAGTGGEIRWRGRRFGSRFLTLDALLSGPLDERHKDNLSESLYPWVVQRRNEAERTPRTVPNSLRSFDIRKRWAAVGSWVTNRCDTARSAGHIIAYREGQASECLRSPILENT